MSAPLSWVLPRLRRYAFSLSALTAVSFAHYLQIDDNVGALKLVEKLTPEVMEEIEKILDNKPNPSPDFGRKRLA
jgi:aryl-alcohol dehydrogenase-like predicted oxidoreductase